MNKGFYIYLKPLDPNLLLANMKKERADKKIEIIPIHQESFDFISFVDFANAIHFNYHTFPMIKKSDKSSYLEVFLNEVPNPIRLPLNYSFKIEFGYRFSYIRVFLRHYMYNFEYITKDDILCIKITNQYQQNPYTYQVFQSFIVPKTIIYESAKYFTDIYHYCPYCIKYYFSKIINRKLKNVQTNFTLSTIEDLLKLCPGYIQINYSNKEKKNFNYISILFPWAISLMESFHYLEIDGSFRAMKPYSFCIFQGIIYNESIPFGISITPTESNQLYQLVFEQIKSISPQSDQFSGKVILSDMGPSIKSICKLYNFIQFFCHRHIIEHFGANSVLGFLVRRILKTYDSEEYAQKCIEISDILDDYIEERKKNKTYTDDFQSKVNDLKTMLSGDNGDTESNYFYLRWALWMRSSHHAGTCSNHNESLHSYINKDLHQCITIESKLSNLISKTLKHLSNLKNRKGTSIRRKLKNMITFIIKKINNATFDISNFYDESCRCNEKEYNYQVLGVEIPCINQVLLPAKEIIKQIILDLKDQNDNITINKLIGRILTYKHILSPLSEEKAKELAINLYQDCPVPLDHLIALVIEVHNCFIFESPEIPEIDNMWDIHQVKETFSVPMTHTISSNTDTNTNSFNYSAEIEDEEIFFSRFQIEDKYFRKKIIMETVREMLIIYPSFIRNIHDAYEICLDNFDEIFKQSKLDVSKIIAKYKIACWKGADGFMEKNSFFE